MPIFTVLICSGAACLSSGEEVVKNKLVELIKEKNLENDVRLIETGCMGPCQYGPVMIVYPDGSYYINLNEEKVEKIVHEHFINGRPV
ncbi:MAG: (2Fe-2S) ferredoxin domain-containing protein, partial [Caldisericia bacterium]|nr:(2Fe-2S) ferredoxin domain-containing protein [Caldisericia bacterium]